MKNQELVNAFRNELKQHSFYYRQRNQLANELIVIEHKKQGLTGRDMSQDRVQGSSDPSIKAMNRLQLIEDADATESKLRAIKVKMDNLENAVNMMDENIAKSIRMIYFYRRSTLYKESKRLYMSKRQLQRTIDHEILKLPQKVLDKVLYGI